MHSLPEELTAELEAEIYTKCHLIIFASQYWTDFPQNIYNNGNWFTSKGITFDNIESSYTPSLESTSFEIDNVDKAFSDLVLSTTLTGEPCGIWVAALDNNLHSLGTPQLIFYGFIDAIKVDRSKARVEVYNHFIKWKTQCPRRDHSVNCPASWTFKGTECAYAGAGTWCDHSWERCLALGNTINYGGFRWITQLAIKDLWWGSLPRLWKTYG